MILLDFLFKVTIYANFSFKMVWSNNFLRFPVLGNNFCQFNLKSGFEVMIPLDFKIMIFPILV